ncbi:hypothetical protein I6E29_08045 [Arcanobacterium haemolyticum]|nr:hypothetical protein [Arcanobacterium haemolyticum]
MMKRMIAVGGALGLVAALAACGGSDGTSSPTPAPLTTATDGVAEPPADETPAGEAPALENVSIVDMQAKLEEAGVVTGTPIWMAASLVGAVNGVKYEDQSAEIYEFAADSPVLAGARDGQSIELEGSGFSFQPTAVNGNLVLYIDAANTNPQPIIDAFSGN